MSEWHRPNFATVTPHLMVEGADDMIEFLLDTFDAEILRRNDRPDGTLIDAEVCIGDSMLLVSEAGDDFGPMPGVLHIYVEECDDTFAAALEAGAVIVTEPTTDPQTAERHAVVTDPCGNVWRIATHLGDLGAEEDVEPPEVYDRDDM